LIHLDTEGLLVQLGYSVSGSTKQHIEKIIKNTSGFEKFERHLIPLKDNLKQYNTLVAMSNSVNYFKIKIESPREEFIKKAKELIIHWAKKYKVTLQRNENNDKVYYILGV
jgi:hypothetical protein